MRRLRISAIWTLALLACMSSSALAFQVNWEGEMRLRYQTPSNSNQESLPLPMDINDAYLTLRLRAAQQRWQIRIDDLVTWQIGSGPAFNNAPFYMQMLANSQVFELWGNGWDLGGATVKSDPVGLIALGSQAVPDFINPSGLSNSTAPNRHKLRTSFRPAGAQLTVDYHRISAGHNDLEFHAERPFGSFTFGGLLRQSFHTDQEKNGSALVGYANTAIGGVDLGVSAGINLMAEEENTAMGLKAETDLAALGGQLHLWSAAVLRDSQFYQPNAQDANWQERRFETKEGAAAVELAATYRTDGDAHRTVHDIVNAPNIRTLRGPVVQGAVSFVRKEGQDEPRTAVVGRFGTPIVAGLFWGGVEVAQVRDEAGIRRPDGSLLPIEGKTDIVESLTLTGSLRYHLDRHGLRDWRVRTRHVFASGTTQGGESASQTDNRIEFFYDVGEIEALFGYRVENRPSWTHPNARMYAQFRVRY